MQARCRAGPQSNTFVRNPGTRARGRVGDTCVYTRLRPRVPNTVGDGVPAPSDLAMLDGDGRRRSRSMEANEPRLSPPPLSDTALSPPRSTRPGARRRRHNTLLHPCASRARELRHPSTNEACSFQVVSPRGCTTVFYILLPVVRLSLACPRPPYYHSAPLVLQFTSDGIRRRRRQTVHLMPNASAGRQGGPATALPRRRRRPAPRLLSR